MIRERPLPLARKGPSRKRLPILVVIVLCALIVGAALVKAVQVATAGPDFAELEGARGTTADNSPAVNPLRFTTTDPTQLRAVTPEQAKEINAAIPIANAANPAASAMALSNNNPSSFLKALECLTDAIYYEAANEPRDGQRAVAQVILNRVRHPAYPHTICGVVYQGAERRTGCQFTFTCDGSLMRPRVPSLWMQARSIAMSAMGGFVYAPVGWSTHYHADYVTPYWASTLAKSTVIGHHIFYRLSSSPRIATLFSAHYEGTEMIMPVASIGKPEQDVLPVEGASGQPVSLADRPVLTREGAALGGKSAPGGSDQAARTLQRWILPPQVPGGDAARKAGVEGSERPAH
jgi:spore germination cell wall hydrolase CwlJ-like protein